VESCGDMDGSVKVSDELDAEGRGGAANGKDVAELRPGHAKPSFTFRACAGLATTSAR
jgi:hypothetical protein